MWDRPIMPAKMAQYGLSTNARTDEINKTIPAIKRVSEFLPLRTSIFIWGPLSSNASGQRTP